MTIINNVPQTERLESELPQGLYQFNPSGIEVAQRTSDELFSSPSELLEAAKDAPILVPVHGNQMLVFGKIETLDNVRKSAGSGYSVLVQQLRDENYTVNTEGYVAALFDGSDLVANNHFGPDGTIWHNDTDLLKLDSVLEILRKVRSLMLYN